MKFGSARGFVRKIIARDMPGLTRDAVKAVEFADSKPSVGLSNRSGELMRKSDQGHALIDDLGDLASRRRSEAAFFRFVTV